MSANARWLIASKAATGLGDLLCNAKTTLPWLMLSAGAPTGWVGLLVPVRESGSMLPQVFIAPWVARVEPRKTAAIGALLGQVAAALAIASVAGIGDGRLIGAVILVALSVLAVARAFASLANKDVLARAVPKGERGRVGGRATSVAGLIGLAGAAAALLLDRPESTGILALVISGGAAAFGLSALLLTRVSESDESGKSKARPNLADALADPRLRRFVLVRFLLAGAALGGPFIVAMGRLETPSLRTLSAFVLAGAAASFVSAGAWGRLADASGRGCMAAGGAVATLAAAGILWVGGIDADVPIWSWATLYFVFSVGYVGVRVGRKTYVVDLAKGAERTQFVASSNTLVSLGLLVAGAGMAALPSPAWALGAATGSTLLGALGCVALAKD